MQHLWTDLRSGVRMLIKYPTLVGRGDADAGAGHRPQHHGVLRGQRRPLQGLAVSRTPTGSSRSWRPIRAGATAPAHQRARISTVWQARQTSFEKLGAFWLRGDEPVERAGAARAIQRRAAHRRRLRGARRAADPGPWLPGWATTGRAASRCCCSATTCGSSGSAGTSDIVGRTIRANGVERTIIGVMPETFAFPDSRVDVGAARDRSRGQTARAGPELSGHREAQAWRQPLAGQGAGQHDRVAARDRVSGDEPRRSART